MHMSVPCVTQVLQLPSEGLLCEFGFQDHNAAHSRCIACCVQEHEYWAATILGRPSYVNWVNHLAVVEWAPTPSEGPWVLLLVRQCLKLGDAGKQAGVGPSRVWNGEGGGKEMNREINRHAGGNHDEDCGRGRGAHSSGEQCVSDLMAACQGTRLCHRGV